MPQSETLYKDPDWGIFALHKGYEAPMPGITTAIGRRTEFFASNLLERIPLIGTFVKASERPFTIGGNYLRFQSFKKWLNLARKAGFDDDITHDGLVKLANWASGRGNIPQWAGQGATFVNALLFAPRYVASRLQLPTLLWHPSPFVRKEAARTLVQFMGAGVSILSLAALAGAKIETDFRSSDVGKIKIGNTRLDIWAGYIQWARFLNQIARGESKVVGTGKIRKKNRYRSVLNLIQSKESPMASVFSDLLAGTTYTGEPVYGKGANVPKLIRERITPLFVQDLWDAIETDGLMGGITAAPGVLGIGVTSFVPKTVYTPTKKRRIEK